jgi:antitoxin (DNA-binding transcriptional repressor) of toxin-antitoxin stability system
MRSFADAQRTGAIKSRTASQERKMHVAEAEKNFTKLVNKVYVEGISVDLERDDKIIARLTPAEPRSALTIGELTAFLRNLPSLGDDADDFAQDVRAIRTEFPAESNSWD